MINASPEELAKEFARRWLSNASRPMHDLGERELIRIIHEAIAADRKIREKPSASSA